MEIQVQYLSKSLQHSNSNKKSLKHKSSYFAEWSLSGLQYVIMLLGHITDELTSAVLVVVF